MKQKMILIFSLILISFLNFGCSKKTEPQTVFKEYIAAWQKNDFSTMYQKLSEESKKNISEKDFVQKNTNIYSGIEMKDLTVTLGEAEKKLKKDKNGVVTLPYTVKMETAAGEIKFSYTASMKEEKKASVTEWVLIWNTKMIFPDLEEGEKVRIDKKKAERGEIRDRYGNPLAVNGVVAEIGIVPKNLKDNGSESKKEIAQILNIKVEQIDKKLSASYVKPDMLIPIDSVSREEAEKIIKLSTIQGVVINNKNARVYPLKEKAAHLIGYVQKISNEELQKLSAEGYGKDDFIGRDGLEKIYEKSLRGEDGAEIYIIDKNGQKKKTLAMKEVKDGKTMKLTIDEAVQIALYDELKEEAGAAVAMHPKIGEVLALVSTPAYDPNKFVLGMKDTEWKVLNENPKKPFSNRFQRTFSPGSTIKPIAAAIGLKTNKIDPVVSRNIVGSRWQKDKSWGNYFVTRVGEYEGPSNLLNALKHSDNIYFAQSTLDIGKEVFQEEVKNFGIGEKLPFEYGTYNSQLSSDGTIKNEMQLADSGYGQGEFLMNPIHLAAIFTSFVNEGNILTPYLELKENPTAKIWKEKVFSKEIADVILSDLTQVVASPEGTGHLAFDKELPLAGKTGTAEIKLNQGDIKGTEIGWFEVVNTNNPKLLIVAMVEDVKERGGSHYVVPKVARIMEQFGK